MAELRRNNHYLSQMYLDKWSQGKKVEVYELLVPNENVPIFQRKSIRGIGSYDSMYVRLFNGEELDDIEKWFGDNYETPARKALDKALYGQALTDEDWYHLIEFLACHIVRSPVFLQKSIEVIKNDFSTAVKDVSEDLKLEKVENHNIIDLPVKVTVGEDSNVNIEMIAGKQSYLWAMYHLLKNSSVLHQHKWGIMNLDPRVSVPTTDNPVVFLNYFGNQNYSLNGAWNQPHTNILFPISPHKMIYCQVGDSCQKEMNLNLEMSEFFKKIICENAYRMIISKEKDLSIPILAPRVVDEELFLQEKKQWKDFQKNYIEEESHYIK